MYSGFELILALFLYQFFFGLAMVTVSAANKTEIFCKNRGNCKCTRFCVIKSTVWQQ